MGPQRSGGENGGLGIFGGGGGDGGGGDWFTHRICTVAPVGEKTGQAALIWLCAETALVALVL